ncbi:hypothetical protein HK105_200070 [Polyrhizophydium stewartii]|uniref:SAP domain-containing protein n=1 Tax=Polyrhizophydium stewartii TaxID=2732419 RepID=A0ABR4NKE8_9FUNG
MPVDKPEPGGDKPRDHADGSATSSSEVQGDSGAAICSDGGTPVATTEVAGEAVSSPGTSPATRADVVAPQDGSDQTAPAIIRAAGLEGETTAEGARQVGDGAIAATPERRARRPVQRLMDEQSAETARHARGKRAVEIRQGKGVPLREIGDVEAQIKALDAGGVVIAGLHTLLFGKASSRHPKADILKFSGFCFETQKQREAAVVRLEHWTRPGLEALCKALCLPATGLKAVLVERVMRFLEAPRRQADEGRQRRKESGVPSEELSSSQTAVDPGSPTAQPNREAGRKRKAGEVLAVDAVGVSPGRPRKQLRTMDGLAVGSVERPAKKSAGMTTKRGVRKPTKTQGKRSLARSKGESPMKGLVETGPAEADRSYSVVDGSKSVTAATREVEMGPRGAEIRQRDAMAAAGDEAKDGGVPEETREAVAADE